MNLGIIGNVIRHNSNFYIYILCSFIDIYGVMTEKGTLHEKKVG